MCALAHYLEAEGIATVVISLIRLHSEKTRPPRGLFVPFELGRPMGNPGDVVGQRDVLMQALSLLQHVGPEPILKDYPDTVVAVSDTTWQPFDLPGGADLIKEFAVVQAAYDRSLAETDRTTFGNSGLAPGEVVRAIGDLLGSGPKGAKRVPSKLIRFMLDDLKTLYFEAACQGDEVRSSAELGNWFWHRTAAGKAIATLRSEFLTGDDKGRRKIAAFMVPGEWVDHLGLEL